MPVVVRHRPSNKGQWMLVIFGWVLGSFFLATPLVFIFYQALSNGWKIFFENLWKDYMLDAARLSLLVACVTVPLNILFGISLAWCVTRYNFFGRRILMILADIPFATSPVIAGLCYLILYGVENTIGHFFSERGIAILFAWPGVLLVTLFVTSPVIARILIPLMQAQGSDEEKAALTLGASGWQIFRRITLPNIQWALFYAAVVCNARAVGEFGAVSVVSGAILHHTFTLPLLVEQLHKDHRTVGAFSAAALLACSALIVLAAKTLFEWRENRRFVRSFD